MDPVNIIDKQLTALCLVARRPLLVLFGCKEVLVYLTP